MTLWIWIGFIVLIMALLALDLGVLHRKAHVIGIREAFGWTAMWVSVAMLFNVFVYFAYENHWLGIGLHVGHPLSGREAALNFFTGYLVEESLSVDNIFVIALIFAYFHVPAMYQHRVLFWGIVGAIVFRGLMITAGTALINRFEWTIYLFGAVLIYAALRLLLSRHEHVEPEHNPLLRLARGVYPVTHEYHGPHFFTMIEGRRTMTPLMVVLLLVESTDILFAVDSVPAVFAITSDPFIVFTSNVFAILGLRSLFFALAGVMNKFRYIKISLVVVLMFVGVKMLLAHHYPIPTSVSLGVIVACLAVGVAASVILPQREDSVGAPLLNNQDLAGLALYTLRQAKRAIVIVIGFTLLVIGVALIFLPGPAFLVIPAGLAILATEFVWARRLLRRVKAQATTLGRSLVGSSQRNSQE